MRRRHAGVECDYYFMEGVREGLGDKMRGEQGPLGGCIVGVFWEQQGVWNG